MQSTQSIQQTVGLATVENLLDVVETRMIEVIGASTSRVSKKLAGAVDAAAYHLGAGGQRVRAKIALQAALAMDLSVADAVSIATTVELLHNASLVHDDIQDGDETRRGQKAVWARFGINTAICTGDLMLSAAYAALCKLENSSALPAMVALAHERTAIAIDGQCADLMANTNAADSAVIDISRYKNIAIAKSGALLSLPIELVLLAAGQSQFLPDAQQAAEAFAIGYQIVDDLDDVQSDAGGNTKGTKGGALNIIPVLKAAGYAGNCVEKARKIGLQHLDTAVDLAVRLPRNAGALLTDYAKRLRARLAQQN